MARLHTALKEQANHLAKRERGRPKQASLRRSVSAAYYALFHRLTFDGTRFLLPARQGALRDAARRAFDHGDMRAVAKAFAGGTPPSPWAGIPTVAPVPGEIRRTAQLFVDLQQKRHAADYDVRATFTRSEVRSLLTRLDRAFHDLDTADRDAREVFFVALLLNRQTRA